jgi:hypothetical protein
MQRLKFMALLLVQQKHMLYPDFCTSILLIALSYILALSYSTEIGSHCLRERL